VRRELLAPELTAATNRHGGHADLASQAVAAAERVAGRVKDLREDKIGEEGIKALIAEAIYNAAAKERSELPKREAQAARAALEGAKAVVAMKLAELAEKAGRP
jgi:hypothetical protein